MNPPSAPAGTFRAELGAGLGALRRGLTLWRTSPRLMLLGAAPALIVSLVFLALFVTLLLSLPTLTATLTPFADGWAPFWRGSTRVGVGIALTVLVAWAMVAWYAAITLMVGSPFYERIADHVERSLGGPPAGRREGWWAGMVRQSGESLRLAVGGALIAACLFLVGLVPVIGTASVLVVGALLGGRLLVTQLTGRALDARGFDLTQRKALLRARRTRTTVFGAAAYLLLLVPVVSVVAMPSVVAGATVLARDLLPTPTPHPTPDRGGWG
ncbi:MAG: EI24 domain-containing protein [Micrococcales bacterium]|nr:EI24 domain-containing protein [Micrococcales bacterium]